MKNHNEEINSIVINVLSEKQTIKSLTQHVLQLCAMLETHDEAPKHDAPRPKRGKKERDYGPTSQRKATRFDAWEILYGKRSEQKARQIADETGLSRGQVYSIQGGYTFRDVKLEEFDDNEEFANIPNNEEIWASKFVGPLQQQ